jgi:hypothetical protein
MKQSALRTAVLAIALSVGCSAQDKIAVVIRVTDPSGAPLAGANVWLRANTTAPRPPLIASTTKQPAGDFTTRLRPGTYDIFVSAACLVPMAPQVQVKVANTGRQAVDIKMKHSDPLTEGCSWPDHFGASIPTDSSPSKLPEQIPNPAPPTQDKGK